MSYRIVCYQTGWGYQLINSHHQTVATAGGFRSESEAVLEAIAAIGRAVW